MPAKALQADAGGACFGREAVSENLGKSTISRPAVGTVLGGKDLLCD